MRQFAFVPFGGAAPPGAIACDGLVPGAALDLSHWSGNATPAAFRRDTSTESALAYADSGGDSSLGHATNNHFDADGLLSVFALVEPDVALRHAEVLVAAAEVGDFDVWPDDERGLSLAFTIDALRARWPDEARAYVELLRTLPHVLDDLAAFADLHDPPRRRLDEAFASCRDGAAAVSSYGPIVVIVHAPGVDELPGPVLSRLAPPDATRWLLAFDRGGGSFDYAFERPRWAWADTVKRQAIPSPSRNASAKGLGPGWTLKHGLGMTGICRTVAPIRRRPDEIAATLLANLPVS